MFKLSLEFDWALKEKVNVTKCFDTKTGGIKWYLNCIANDIIKI